MSNDTPSTLVLAKILWEKAHSRFSAIRSNEKNGFLEIAFEQAHFCVEIAFNAILTSHGWTSEELKSFGHNLKDLASANCKGKDLIQAQMRGKHNQALRVTFRRISTAWRMQYRYEQIPYKSDEIRELLRNYEEVYQWILENFKQDVNN